MQQQHELYILLSCAQHNNLPTGNLTVDDISNIQSIALKYLCSSNSQLLTALNQSCESNTNISSNTSTCGHLFEKGEPVYRCKNCALDETCVLCLKCFRATSHEGHDISFSIATGSGGCCDCGDVEAWKIPLDCSLHSPNLHNEASDKIYSQEIINPIKDTIAVMLDFILDTFDACPEQIEQMTEKQIIDKYQTSENMEYACILWNDESHSFQEVIDQVMEALDCDFETAKHIAEAVDSNGRNVIKITKDLKKIMQISEIINIVGLAVSIRPASDVFKEETAGVLLKMLSTLPTLFCFENNVGSTYQNLEPLVRKIIIEEMMAPRRLMNQAYMNNWEYPKYFSFFDSNRSLSPAHRDPHFDYSRKVISTRLHYMILTDIKLWAGARDDLRKLFTSTFIIEESSKKDLDREYDVSIFNFGVQLFTVPSIIKALVSETDIIPAMVNIIKTLFITDAVPTEYSISKFEDSFIKAKSNPTPPFAVMKCESEAVRNKRYFYLFSNLRYFLTSDIVQKELFSKFPSNIAAFIDLALVFQGMQPQIRSQFSHVEYETEHWIHALNLTIHTEKLFKITAQCFGDIRQPEKAFSLLLSFIVMTTCSLNVWCISEHIKASVESEKQRSNGPFGFKTISISGKQYTIPNFSVSKEKVSLHYTAHWFYAHLLSHLPAVLSKLKDVSQVNRIWEMIFCSDSLMDPLENAKSTVKKLAQTIDLNCRRLLLFEYPLRSLVFLSQIRVGAWVRNGYMMRTQGQHFRETLLRDCYDNTIFLMQTAASVLEPDLFLVTVLERFELTDWFNSSISDIECSLELSQRTNMVEDLLSLLIFIISERSKLLNLPLEHELRREIIHHLAANSDGLAHSELVKIIPDNLIDQSYFFDGSSKTFDDILELVSNFKFPESASHGVYELKDELYDCVDPWFWHLTRTERSELDLVLKKRAVNQKKSRNNVKFPKARIPTLSPFLEQNCFKKLVSIYNETLLTQIIFYSIWNVTKKVEEAGEVCCPSDVILSAALHIILLGISESENSNEYFSGKFFKNIVLETFPIKVKGGSAFRETTLLELICSLIDRANEEDIKDDAPTLRHIISKIEETQLPEALGTIHGWRDKSKWDLTSSANVHTGETSLIDNSLSESEKRKNAAKLRQKAIMSQFAQAQQSFLANYEDEIEDEYDDELPVNEPEKEVISSENRTVPFPSGSCIVCQEETSLDDERVFGVLGLVQNSNLQRKMNISEELNGLNYSNCTWDTEIEKTGDLVSFSQKEINTFAAMHASTCGHLMHINCFESYLKSIENRQKSQPTRNHPENIRKKEFLCPLCKTFGNCIFPILSPSYSQVCNWNSTNKNAHLFSAQNIYEWLDKMICDTKSNTIVNRFHTDNPVEQIENEISGQVAAVWMLQPTKGNYLSTDVMNAFEMNLLPAIQRVLENSKIRFPGNHRSEYETLNDLWELMYFTIGNNEILYRGTGVNLPKLSGVNRIGLLDALSSQLQIFLPVLKSCIHSFRSLISGDIEVDKRISSEILNPLFLGSESTLRFPILSEDPFKVLLKIAMSLQFSESTKANVLLWVRIFWYAEMFKVIISFLESSILAESSKFTENEDKKENQYSSVFNEFLLWILNTFDIPTKHLYKLKLLYSQKSIENICESVGLIYMRRCVILLYSLGIVPPTGTCGFGFENEFNVSQEEEKSELVRLSAYLSLPTLDDLFSNAGSENDTLYNLFEVWMNHLNDVYPLQDKTQKYSMGSRALNLSIFNMPWPYELVELPDKMDLIFEKSIQFVCKECNTSPIEPAICLICGLIVCSQTFCCATEFAGECNQHMKICGGNIGIFFLVKKCVILLLCGKNGHFMTSPYLDNHGESDLGLKRGKPLFLNKKRYDEIRKMWLNHMIPSFIGRKLDQVFDFGGWESL